MCHSRHRPLLYPPRESMRIWIWVYMDRFGHPPAWSLGALLEQDTLSSESRTARSAAGPG
jgi:hypothetical protein